MREKTYLIILLILILLIGVVKAQRYTAYLSYDREKAVGYANNWWAYRAWLGDNYLLAEAGEKLLSYEEKGDNKIENEKKNKSKPRINKWGIDESKVECEFDVVAPYSKKDILKYLKYYIDHNEDTIHSCKDIPTKRNNYGASIEVTIQTAERYGIKNNEFFNLLLEVINKKQNYPWASAAAVEALSKYDNKRDKVIPILIKLAAIELKDDMPSTWQPKTKWKAAQNLLFKYGKIDEGLKALDELAEFGVTSALGDIYHAVINGSKWKGKGIEIIRKALNYENKETKMLAALFMIRLINKGIVKDDIKPIKDMVIKTSWSILYQRGGLVKIEEPKGMGGFKYSDRVVLETAVHALVELGSKEAIPLLERISQRWDTAYVRIMAIDALRYLKKYGR